MSGEDREVDSKPVPGGAERLRTAFQHARLRSMNRTGVAEAEFPNVDIHWKFPAAKPDRNAAKPHSFTADQQGRWSRRSLN
jgi:hypothetical protein